MAQVFIAYKRVDAARAQEVRRALEALDVPLFMDVKMDGSQNYIAVINTQLSEAEAVLVLWTEASVVLPSADENNFVLSEAERGYSRRILVAAAFDRIAQQNLPVPFSTINTPDVSDWIDNGAPQTHAGWQRVLEALGRRLNRPGLAQLARIAEQGDNDAKHEFLRQFPNDPSAARIAAELAAAEREIFDKTMRDAARRLGRRQSETRRKLQDCQKEFDEQIATLATGQGFVRPDPMRVFDGIAEFLRDQVEDYEKSSQAYQQRVEQLEQAAAATVERVTLRDGELSQLRNTMQGEIAELVQKAEAAGQAVDEKERQLGDLNARHRVLESKAALLPELSERLAVTERETMAMTAQIASLKAENATLISKPPPITKKHVGFAAGAAIALGLVLGWGAVMMTASVPILARDDASEQELKAARQQLASMQTDLASAQTGKKSSEQQLGAQIQSRDRELDGLRAQLTQTQSAKKQTDDLLKREQDQTKTLTASIQEKTADLTNVFKLLDRQKTDLEQQKKDTDQQRSEASSLRTQLAAATREAGELRTKLNQAAAPTPPARVPTQAIYVPASRTPPQYTLHVNYDLVGGDYQNEKEVTREWCVSQCQSNALCVAYTYDKWKKHCSLKSSVGALTLEPKGDTGVRSDQAAPQKSGMQERFCTYDGKAFPDSPSQTYTGASRDSCRVSCGKDQSCIAFTFVANSNGACRLFNTTTEPVSESRSNSEVKAQKAASRWCH